jgi:hypothetical protein
MTDSPNHRVALIPKNTRESLAVELSEFKGHRLLNVRVVVPRDDGSESYTRQGFGLRLDLMPELARALVEAQSEAARLGWLTASKNGG